MKNKTKPTRQQLSAEAITLSIAGLSCREIAKRLGTSPATISRILNKPDNSHNNSTTTTTTHNTTLDNYKDTPSTPTRTDKNQAIIDKVHSTVLDIITQIQQVTDGETDIAKLATAADKLSTIAERITNLAQLNNNNTNTFLADFQARHTSRHKNKN